MNNKKHKKNRYWIRCSIFSLMIITFFSSMLIRGNNLRHEYESKMNEADERIMYGDYLGAYELYMEIYTMSGGWRDVSERAEWALEMHNKQQSIQCPESGVIYRYPQPVPRFEEGDNK